MSDPVKEMRVRLYKSIRNEVRRAAALGSMTPNQWIRSVILAALGQRQDKPIQEVKDKKGARHGKPD